MSLGKKALLVKVTVHRGQLSVKDKKAQHELAERHNADSEMINVKKRKFLREDTKPLEKAINKVVPTFHYYTLPFQDGGWRLVTVDVLPKLEEELRKINNEIEEALSEMSIKYEEMLNNARRNLNTMFDPQEYKEFAVFKSKFSIETFYNPVPESGDVRVEADRDTIDSLKKQIEQQKDNAVKAAMSELWERTIFNINRLKDRLEAYKEAVEKEERKPRMTKAVVEHIQDLIKMLPSMNITNDPKLEQVRQKLESEFADITIEHLKNDEAVRENSINVVNGILKNIDGL